MEPTLTLVVVGKNADQVRGFKLDNVIGHVDELVVIDNREMRYGGQGIIGNRYLDSCRSDVLGLVHADTEFGPESLRIFAKQAAENTLAGIVGRSLEGAYIWSKQGGKVSTLDGCSVFLRPNLGLRFDPVIFDGFHLCVEDLCLQAVARDIQVIVPVANASHIGLSTFEPHWQKQYRVYQARFKEKWQGVRYATT